MTKICHNVYLIKHFKDYYFISILDEEKKGSNKNRKRRCNVCESCQTPDCGECIHCKNMIKFGGNGKSKQACVKRACVNMVEKEFDILPSDEEGSEDEAENKENVKSKDSKIMGKLGTKDFTENKSLELSKPKQDKENQEANSKVKGQPRYDFNNNHFY